MLKTFDYTSHGYDDTLFNEIRATDGLVCVGHKRFKGKVEPAAIAELGEVLNYSSSEGNRETFIIRLSEDLTTVKVNLSGTSSHRVAVATKNMGEIDKHMARLSVLFQEVETDKDTVPVRFWYNGPHGPSSRSRTIKVSEWDTIKPNYNPGVQVSIDELMKYDATSENGLILWTGEPGTGKTTAIRALANSWKKWANISVITDPEIFLNNISYLNDVMFEEDEVYVDGEFITGEPKPTLLILEDAGELITAHAKQETGQALSRLLNVADGLLGQGVQLFILITTNEYIDNLHPAILRPGRCISQFEFGEFTQVEAQAWLDAHNVKHTAKGKMSIANLYALLHGKTTVVNSGQRKHPLGFVMDEND
jgi:hypothetical protein